MAGQNPYNAGGSGIARRKPVKPVKLPVREDTPLSEASDWMDVPEVDNQIQEEGAFKLGAQEVLILDLSNTVDLKRYNDILTVSVSKKANLVVVSEDVKFVEKTGNFKVFLKVQHIQFRKLFKKGHKPASVEAQEEQIRNS